MAFMYSGGGICFRLDTLSCLLLLLTRFLLPYLELTECSPAVLPDRYVVEVCARKGYSVRKKYGRELNAEPARNVFVGKNPVIF